MISKAAAVLMSPIAMLEDLPGPWAGLVVIGLAATAGAGGYAIFADVTTHEQRIDALEDSVGIDGRLSLPSRVRTLEQWRVVHTDTVTRPGLRDIRELQVTTDTFGRRLERIERMVRFMCEELTPEQCPPPTLNPGD